jgi:hypothetical protein
MSFAWANAVSVPFRPWGFRLQPAGHARGSSARDTDETIGDPTSDGHTDIYSEIFSQDQVRLFGLPYIFDFVDFDSCFETHGEY